MASRQGWKLMEARNDRRARRVEEAEMLLC